ncbi:uncharacterized protein [Lolium perenne]|uniref:uncharacterized protein n=1 Tax=Lolium perenne TaxID=4522 RepID=UPI003A995B57
MGDNIGNANGSSSDVPYVLLVEIMMQRPPPFEGVNFKRWLARTILWLTTMRCFDATKSKTEGELTPLEEKSFEEAGTLLRGAIIGVLGENIVDSYLSITTRKNLWDALEAKFGVSNAGKKARAKDHVLEVLREVLVPIWYRSKIPVRQVQEQEQVRWQVKIEGKHKASQPTNFKKKTDKKGVCHICGDPDHWAPNCPNLFDKRRHGKGGKTANIVIDTEMNDVGYGIFPTVLSVCHSPEWWIDKCANVTGTFSVLMGNGSHATVCGLGTVDLKFTSGMDVRPKNVHHVPPINKNRVSGSLLCRDG